MLSLFREPHPQLVPDCPQTGAPEGLGTFPNGEARRRATCGAPQHARVGLVSSAAAKVVPGSKVQTVSHWKKQKVLVWKLPTVFQVGDIEIFSPAFHLL